MNFLTIYTNGKRTLEIVFSASPKEAERVVGMTRTKYRDKFKIVAEIPSDGMAVVALTHNRWRPVPTYLRYELPAFVMGALMGLRDVVQSK
jgi:hypothetical protein